eukprot:SAG25_NODE_1126_length_3875_cov_18.200477_4_plen_91_part_00
MGGDSAQLRGKNSTLTTGLPSRRLRWLTFAECGFKSAAKALLHSYSSYTPFFPYKRATIRVVKMHLAFSEKKLRESFPVRCDTDKFWNSG